jgi:hypothetical protein
MPFEAFWYITDITKPVAQSYCPLLQQITGFLGWPIDELIIDARPLCDATTSPLPNP